MRYPDSLLDALRRRGDATADAVIDDIARSGQVRAVSDLLRQLVDNDQPVPEELPPSVARWLEDTGQIPEWADFDRMERGAELVRDHGPQIAVILSTASLVYCYAAYPGVKVLNFSHRLDQDAYRRVGETAQYVLTVTNPGSMLPGGRGIRKTQKVRLLHASIRHLVGSSDRWDTEVWGVPVCQEDLVGTLMSFSYVVVDGLRKFGVRVSAGEAEDYLYLWRVIGDMLGIERAVVPTTMAEAQELAETIAGRHHQRSDDGIAMTAALLEMHTNTLAGRAGLAPAITRYLIGDEVCDLVDVPRSKWDRVVRLGAPVGRMVDKAQSGRLSALVNQLGASILADSAIRAAGNRSASFSIPVPAEMHQRWTASGVFPALDPSALDPPAPEPAAPAAPAPSPPRAS